MSPLSNQTLNILESWWASFLGLETFPSKTSPFCLTSHPGLPNLGNWEGIYVLVRKGSVILSAPGGLQIELSKYLSDTKAASPDVAILDILGTLGTVIGPAFIGYRETPIELNSISYPSIEVLFHDNRIGEFRSKIPASEWDEAGISKHQEKIFALRDGDRIVAVGGYERFEKSGSQIGHMSVVVAPNMRNRGLAKTIISNLVNVILNEGLIPQYRALYRNTGSMNVANSLGFEHFADQYAVKNLICSERYLG